MSDDKEIDVKAVSRYLKEMCDLVSQDPPEAIFYEGGLVTRSSSKEDKERFKQFLIRRERARKDK